MRNKLGASPQLECWNGGIMEQWVLGKWGMVLLKKFLLTRELIELMGKKFPLKTNIPLFHHSIIPCARQKIIPRQNTCSFNKLYNFRSVQLVCFIFLLGLGSLLTACGLLGDENEAKLKDVDAIQAMEIANQWKWTEEEIKSHVTTREVVFEFSNGRVKKILLPEEKMLVAVAPYVNKTHR